MADLPAEVDAGGPPALKGPPVELAEGDSPRGDLGPVEARGARDAQVEAGDGRRGGAPLLPREAGEGRPRRRGEDLHEASGEAGPEELAEGRGGAPPRGGEDLPIHRVGCRRGRALREAGARRLREPEVGSEGARGIGEGPEVRARAEGPPLGEGARHGDGGVEGGRPAHPVVGEEQAPRRAPQDAPVGVLDGEDHRHGRPRVDREPGAAQRGQGGHRIHHPVAEGGREPVAEPRAPGLRDGAPSRRDDEAAREEVPGAPALPLPLHGADLAAEGGRHARLLDRAEEGREDGLRLPRRGEELPHRLLDEGDASALEERPHRRGRETGEDPAHDRGRVGVEVPVRHGGVRHVAAPAAAHEDLPPRALLRVEEDHGGRARGRDTEPALRVEGAPGREGREDPRRSRADHRHVAGPAAHREGAVTPPRGRGSGPTCLRDRRRCGPPRRRRPR